VSISSRGADNSRVLVEAIGLGFRECTLSCKCHAREGRRANEIPTAHKVKYIGVRLRGRPVGGGD